MDREFPEDVYFEIFRHSRRPIERRLSSTLRNNPNLARRLQDARQTPPRYNNQYQLVEMINNGDLAALEDYYYECDTRWCFSVKRVQFTRDGILSAIENNQLDILKWFHRIGVDMAVEDGEIAELAIREGQLEILQWIYYDLGVDLTLPDVQRSAIRYSRAYPQIFTWINSVAPIDLQSHFEQARFDEYSGIQERIRELMR